MRLAHDKILPFRCADDAAAVLGAHDGVDSWTVHVGHERSPSEQRLVSAHERLHHELHSTTPWGFVMSVMAGRPDQADALPVWHGLAEGCQKTHEVFATYFAVLLDDTHPGLLAGNTVYENYLGVGEELRDHMPRSHTLPHLHVDGLLRAVMAPSQLLGVDPAAALRLRMSDVRNAWLPDERLRRLRALLAGGEGTQFPPPPVLPPAASDFGYASYRDELAVYLTELGLPSMLVAEYRDWTMALFAAAQGAGIGTFEILDGPRDVIDSLFDDYQRERLRLWDEPLPVVAISPEDENWEITWLARGHQVLGAHAWLIWLRGDLFRRQFRVPDDLVPGDRPFLGFLAVDRTHGEPVARLWPFDLLSPAIVAQGLKRSTGLPLVFFTTLATILDSAETDDFRGIEPAFVLIDTNFTAFLDRSREGGAQLTYRIARLRGDRDLVLFVIENSEHAGVVYLVTASLAAAQIIRAYLDRLPDTQVRLSETTAERYEPYIDALIHHLVGSFYQLDLYGGTAR
jgi:hypothetical protein